LDIAERQMTSERRQLPVPGWIVAVLLAIVVPLSLIAAGTSVLPADVTVTRFVQAELPVFVEPLVAAGNFLGLAPVVIAIASICAFVLAARGHGQLAFVIASATLAQLANVVLKQTFASPRPSSGLVHVAEDASGFGFPSGHTMGTTVIALIILYVVARLMPASLTRHLLFAAILFVPLMTGIARIETGAHWPSDVLGAWLWGTLSAIAIIPIAQHGYARVTPAVARVQLGRVVRAAVPEEIGRTIPR
jgi:undecaprenyl-diphosphatase